MADKVERQARERLNDEQWERLKENRSFYNDRLILLLEEVSKHQDGSPEYDRLTSEIETIRERREINKRGWRTYYRKEVMYFLIPVFIAIAVLIFPFFNNGRTLEQVAYGEKASLHFALIIGAGYVVLLIMEAAIKADKKDPSRLTPQWDFPARIRRRWTITSIASIAIVAISGPMMSMISHPLANIKAKARQGQAIDKSMANPGEKQALQAAEEILPLVRASAQSAKSLTDFYARLSPYGQLASNATIARIQKERSVLVEDGSVEGLAETCPGIMVIPRLSKEQVTKEVQENVWKRGVRAATIARNKELGIGRVVISLAPCGKVSIEQFSSDYKRPGINANGIRVELFR
jgi:hypothetical protein